MSKALVETLRLKVTKKEEMTLGSPRVQRQVTRHVGQLYSTAAPIPFAE